MELRTETRAAVPTVKTFPQSVIISLFGLLSSNSSGALRAHLDSQDYFPDNEDLFKHNLNHYNYLQFINRLFYT